MPIRLLIVDDQAIIRRGLATILELEEGLEVVGEADNGERAIAQVTALQPDVVLMDVRMPIMDGVAATRALMSPSSQAASSQAASSQAAFSQAASSQAASSQAASSQQHPSPALKILILTTFDDTDAARQALQAGAAGYLLKDTPIEELVQAIHLVHRGYSQLAPGLAQRLLGLGTAPSLASESVGVSGLEGTDSVGVGAGLGLSDLGASDSGASGLGLSDAGRMAHPTSLTPREQQILGLIAQGASNREIAEQLYISERTVRNHVTNILGSLGLRDRTQAAIFVHEQKQSHPSPSPQNSPSPKN